MSEPKATLFATYGGFADKRFKDLSKASLFFVDDRTEGDYGADKRLLSPFCAISADVISDAEVKIQLTGNVPLEQSVQDWAVAFDATMKTGLHRSLTFSVRRDSLSRLSELAQAIELIIKPGRRYSVPSYKYACPRAARSLRKLEQALRAAWDA